MSKNVYPQIFSTEKKDETSLQNTAQQYLWCSLAQINLLNFYKKNNLPEFNEQAIKTALLFNNGNWLNWQLHSLSQESNKENIQEVDATEHQNETSENIILNVAPANTAEEEIAFEPLHTVDYFASQGIKITEEPVTNDKLGNQLKSFTEWLKSMKKVHKENLLAADEQTDKKIQHIAEVSNANADVVTEAMADVLIKQNKIEKAIEVYNKLSLLNPAKSAYFAAKIQRLKTA